MEKKWLLAVALLCVCLIKTHAGISVVNGLSHIHKIQNGEQYKGTIEIKNTGIEVENLRIFSSDFTYNSEGQSFYNNPPSHPRSNATWLKIGASEVSVQPGETYLLPYQMNVPDSLSLTGSYWSVVMIEPVGDLGLEKARNAIGITTKVRYAVQIIGDLGNDHTAKILFKNAEVEYIDGEKLLYVDLEDAGELYHRVVVSAEFFDLETGESKGIFFSPKQSLHPNNSKRYIINIGELSDGEYQSVLLANCEDENFFGVNVSIKIDN